MTRRGVFAILMLVFMGACATGRHAVETGPFPETVDELADIEAARLVAIEESKLLLVVLGANWCHDSEALIETFEDPQITTILEAHYERVLINVGEFEQGYMAAEQYGLPIYAHTPTLLIIEPESETLVNWDDHYIFRDSARLEHEEVRAYLDEHHMSENWKVQPGDGREAHDAWSQVIAERIRAGYGVISKYEEKKGAAFTADWRALSKMRYSFSADYPAALLQLSETGELGELPVYAPLPWE